MEASDQTPLPVFYGETVTVTCDAEHSLISGERTITCGAQFSYGGGKPECMQGTGSIVLHYKQILANSFRY